MSLWIIFISLKLLMIYGLFIIFGFLYIDGLE